MNLPKKILVLGSGAIKIGEAGEFDYSGSQCLKAIKEEGIKTILVNPNIATIQTSRDLADRIYFLPVTPYFVQKVIRKEKPDGVLLAFGGQTALNCALALDKEKVFGRLGVKVLGTPVSAIRDTEDRQLFTAKLEKEGLLSARSIAVKNKTEAMKAICKIGFPVILRVGFALGGLGSQVVRQRKEFLTAIEKALSASPQVLIEEYLGGWKEIEYEVVRDKFDNCITVCNMENFDPMGIHTGESIVVAPSQTLTDFEYQRLRWISIKLIRALGIIGECNIQFALSHEKFDYRIIEVNARLSRSSALASKATGYPLAYVAAKLSLGYPLYEIQNKITGKTKAFFEPALDYLALKFPRWDLEKFKYAEEIIGTEMKSVGEVMAIDRNFEAALQKAIRMLNIGQNGMFGELFNHFLLMDLKELETYLSQPTTRRVFAVAAAIYKGMSVDTVNRITGIDIWFLNRINGLVKFNKQLKILSENNLLNAKRLGFSDNHLAQISKLGENEIRTLRIKSNCLPAVKQIDTVAAEFPAQTNYLYTTYTEKKSDDLCSSDKKTKKVIILGSGPYCIGSSVEFDWCAVNASWQMKRSGFQSIMVNCNPETVSTDFDIGDKLYFEELSFERIADICQIEKPDYLILSFGGQIPNNLAPQLSGLGIPILGTSVASIDLAENRNKFSRLLDKLGIVQPHWESFTQKSQAFDWAKNTGFPVLVRPSYVLSGAAMFVAHHQEDLESFLDRSLEVSKEYPLVITKFIENAREIDVDGVAGKGNVIITAISEHVENAGVHSGDATLVYPAQGLSAITIQKLDQATRKIVGSLNISGPFNIQYLSKNGDISVIECNLRASRSFPFVSKVSGINFVNVAIDAMLGKKHPVLQPHISMVGVKTPQFSFTRIKGADPVLRVEMASTGEVACMGSNLYDAYLKSLLSTGFKMPEKCILLSVGGETNKRNFLASAGILAAGFKLVATPNTHDFLINNGIKSEPVYKISDKKAPSVLDVIKHKKVDLVINISNTEDLAKIELQKVVSDGYMIRRAAADFNIPLITNIENAILFTSTINKIKIDDLEIKGWDEYNNIESEATK